MFSRFLRIAALQLCLFVIGCNHGVPGAAYLPGPPSAPASSGSQGRQRLDLAVQRPLTGSGALDPSAAPAEAIISRLLILEAGTGLTDLSSQDLRRPLAPVPIANGSEVSIEARVSPAVVSISVDTQSSIVSLKRTASQTWSADFVYLNLSNDPTVSPVMTIIVSSKAKKSIQTIPVKIIHDS